MEKYTIRDAVIGDANSICHIYNHYVLNTTVTFETSAITLEEMEKRIIDTTSIYPYLVYEHEGNVIGYCYVSSWKNRCAYNSTAESSVYLHKDFTRQGIGSKLYEALFKKLDKGSLHAIIAGVALPNEGSTRLHERFGFEKVAHFKQTGHKFNQWIDVAYWEIIL
ncbi:phosphinothricin acetyltransferase [Macellibacteroides sp. HH-ZS]|nr:phosphinothricin acetyltransferase [Macellibacteroides sp. HH-ZS]